MKVRICSNLFKGSRVDGVVIPGWGEEIDLPDERAQALIALGHAEDPDGPVTPNPATPRYERVFLHGRHAAIAAQDVPVPEAPVEEVPSAPKRGRRAKTTE